MSVRTFDLIVIGAGSGGLGAAMGMLELGFNVLLIDRKAGDIGGECVNTGCIPSKALLHIAKQIYDAKNSSRFGLKVEGNIDIEEVKNYITRKQDRIREHENVEYLRKKGMNVTLGEASFISKTEVLVNGEVFKAKNIVIATGSSPKKIDIRGAEGLPVFTNVNIFEIDFIPENFVFIGAGPVSIELGQAFSRLGSKVTIVNRGKQILKKEDPEISDILQKKLEEEGIDFLFETEVEKVEGNTAFLKSKSGKTTNIPVDAIFMGLGRVLNFGSLDLEKANIKTKEGKIVLNDKLQTTNKKVFVSGDAADNFKFSHAAEMHNMLLLNNFISPVKKKLNFDHFPWVTFTDPQVATFGLNEEKLKNRKMAFERLETSFEEDDKAITDDYEYGKLILFIEKKRFNPGNAKILGGSMIAPQAGEIVQELILANVAGVKLKVFMDKIYPYPTAGNINKITSRNRFLKQLSPWMKKMMVKWYRVKE